MVTRTTPVHPKYVGFQDGGDDVNCQFTMMMMMIWLLNIDCKYDDGIDFDHDDEEDDNCGNDDDNLWLLVIRTKVISVGDGKIPTKKVKESSCRTENVKF